MTACEFSTSFRQARETTERSASLFGWDSVDRAELEVDVRDFFSEVRLEAAEQIAERVRAAVAAMELPGELGSDPISLTVGIAERAGAESLDRCIDRADQGLYAGKQAGKNRVAPQSTSYVNAS